MEEKLEVIIFEKYCVRTIAMAYSPVLVNPKYPLILFVIFCCSGCAGKKNDVQWDKVQIDTGIANDSIYQQLDKQEEVLSLLEAFDTLHIPKKRSSNVAYYRGEKISPSFDQFSKYNSCKAFISESSKLQVKVGLQTGFSGNGFNIYYRDRKFYTKPYFFIDVVNVDEEVVEPVHEIIYQKLTLDKTEYAIGDSLYGNINFQLFEIVEGRDTIWHFGRGSFRAKVERLPE